MTSIQEKVPEPKAVEKLRARCRLAATTAQLEASVPAGRLSPLRIFPSSLGGTLCAS